jgi:ribonuclease E
MSISIQSNQIVISEKNQLAAVYNKKKLKELDISRSQYQIGSIYVGEVESLLPNINAAFIKLAKLEKNGFIQLNSLLPKKLKQKTRKQIHNFKTNRHILVQVVKEPTGTKGPSLTTNIGILGKYLIFLPFGEGVSISKKIPRQKEKQALKALVTLLKPLSTGLLIKKEAYKISDSKLLTELRTLKEKWSKICARLEQSSSPTLLTDKTNFIRKVIKKFYSITTTKISIDTNLGVWRMYAILTSKIDKRKPAKLLLEYYDKKISLVKTFYLDRTIHATLQPRINLITGGYIIIEKTEALTAIDINSGSFSHTATSRASLLWVNCEAAIEIGRQLKIRNIGGIIVVDFIDMDYQKDQMTLLNHFNNVLKKDTGNPKIIQLSEIGLVELTRKRQGQNIYDVFGHTCSRCNGLGQYFHFYNVKKNKNVFCLETASIYCIK